LDGVQKFGTLGYIPNSEWEITGNSATRNVVKYSCCAEEYADLTFTIRMKRNSGFYLRVLLLPTLLLSVMVLIMFWIPPQRPDRTSLGECPGVGEGWKEV
jgi:nicotinic acetylcholine receptor